MKKNEGKDFDYECFACSTGFGLSAVKCVCRNIPSGNELVFRYDRGRNL